jgi:hypothetical protein
MLEGTACRRHNLIQCSGRMLLHCIPSYQILERIEGFWVDLLGQIFGVVINRVESVTAY